VCRKSCRRTGWAGPACLRSGLNQREVRLLAFVVLPTWLGKTSPSIVSNFSVVVDECRPQATSFLRSSQRYTVIAIAGVH
jgi:hypothetical protein